jgi:hypothetical protein
VPDVKSVDRLMTQISGFMNEISDEFKIIVVEAVRSLCLKFKEKYKTMIDFPKWEVIIFICVIISIVVGYLNYTSKEAQKQ